MEIGLSTDELTTEGLRIARVLLFPASDINDPDTARIAKLRRVDTTEATPEVLEDVEQITTIFPNRDPSEPMDRELEEAIRIFGEHAQRDERTYAIYERLFIETCLRQLLTACEKAEEILKDKNTPESLTEEDVERLANLAIEFDTAMDNLGERFPSSQSAKELYINIMHDSSKWSYVVRSVHDMLEIVQNQAQRSSVIRGIIDYKKRLNLSQAVIDTELSLIDERHQPKKRDIAFLQSLLEINAERFGKRTGGKDGRAQITPMPILRISSIDELPRDQEAVIGLLIENESRVESIDSGDMDFVYNAQKNPYKVGSAGTIVVKIAHRQNDDADITEVQDSGVGFSYDTIKNNLREMARKRFTKKDRLTLAERILLTPELDSKIPPAFLYQLLQDKGRSVGEGGTGIGMHKMMLIAMSKGGFIEVDSTPNEKLGTAVRLVTPRDQNPENRDEFGLTKAESARRHQVRRFNEIAQELLTPRDIGNRPIIGRFHMVSEGYWAEIYSSTPEERLALERELSATQARQSAIPETIAA